MGFAERSDWLPSDLLVLRLQHVQCDGKGQCGSYGGRAPGRLKGD
jgi:hypothetical protein